METKAPKQEPGAAGEAAKSPAAPANILVKTTRKQVRIKGAVVSGIPNFGITQAEADTLVAQGLAVIVGTI
ncbi:MAG: hypothetical protein ABIT37_05845 [Luteolibacter sp.]